MSQKFKPSKEIINNSSLREMLVNNGKKILKNVTLFYTKVAVYV